MNATRILKEARPLFWPWCAVALAGALPLVYPLDWIARSIWSGSSPSRCLRPSRWATNSSTGRFPCCFLNPLAGWESGARS